MREIIESDSFKQAVAKLGGYRAVDDALEPIIEALYRNPYGFDFFENDWVKLRYARTKTIYLVPALVVTFSIDSTGNVILDHIEKDQV